MLALITQTKVQRPWIQLGTGTAVPISLRSLDEPKATSAEDVELPELPAITELLPELETPVKKCQRKISRIPRRIRPASQSQPKETPLPRAIVAPVAATASAPLVVRSTRTSRCRIQLAHPEWQAERLSSSVTSVGCCSPVGSPSSVSSKRESSESQRGACGKRKCLAEPQCCVIQIEIEIEKKTDRKQLLRLQCCDQKQVLVPSQLINRYSQAMCERQREANFCFSRAIPLDSISSSTVLRVVQWMQQHWHEDISQLATNVPSLQNARSEDGTWDERFLGVELEPVLQLLLAARALGINPLMEHTMLYFVQLIEQRHCTSEQLQIELKLMDNQLAFESNAEETVAQLPQSVAAVAAHESSVAAEEFK